MLGENDFVEMIALGPDAVWRKVRSKTMRTAMQFIRELQESLAAYARYHAYDKVQEGALRIQHHLEKSIRAEYFAVKRRSMMRTGLVLPEKTMKQRIKDDWGKFYKTLAY
jgi:hemoglobin-like flavoprotein